LDRRLCRHQRWRRMGPPELDLRARPHQRHLQYLRRTRRWDARLQSANRRTLGHRGGNGYRLVRRQGQRAAGLVRADLRHAEQLARHGSPALRICFRHGHALCDGGRGDQSPIREHDGRAVRNGLRQQSRLDRGARHRSRGLGSVDGEAGIPLRRPQRLQLQRGLRRPGSTTGFGRGNDARNGNGAKSRLAPHDVRARALL